MLIRRAFYRWQFAAAIVLPIWLLIGYAIFGSSGWGVIGLMFAAIYRLLPDVRLAWRNVWVGAAVTALLFTLGKSLIGL